MAIAFDATSKGFVSGAASLTISQTVGSGSDRALVVTATCVNSTDFLASSTVTYNGVSMGSPVVTPAVGATNNYVYVWVLVNPPTGTANVVITPSSSAYIKAVCSSWTGVDQTTPVSASAKASSAFAGSPYTLSIAASSGVAVDFLANRASSKAIVPDGTQTQLGTNLAGTLTTCGGSYKAGATAMQWTHPDPGTASIAYAVIALAAAGGGGDTTAPILTSPTGTQTGGTTGSGTVVTDEANGTLYFLATTNATETAATVKASGGTQTITTTGSKSVTFSSLSPSTTYYAHYVHRDAAGNDSTRVSSSSFTTTSGSNPTITTPPLKNNTGTVLASLSGWTVNVYNKTTGALVLQKTGQSTNGSGVITFSDAGLGATTEYAYECVHTTYGRILPLVTTT